MYVNERFELAASTKDMLRAWTPNFGFGQFSEFIFYKHYSRPKPNGLMESWADVVIRSTEGCMSIRKDHYIKNNLGWEDSWWQHYAVGFATSLFNMDWTPPGRGLWAMGTDFMYERGAMCLYNCAYTNITDDIHLDIHWLMDCSMNGVGVGFCPERNNHLDAYHPVNGVRTIVIADSREGWCDSVRDLIKSYLTPNSPAIYFDYSKIRPAGSVIHGFGGIASGPEPLKLLHTQIVQFFSMYIDGYDYDVVQLKSDIANAVGVCVVSGNVRRSAEIACGSIYDETFLNLKDYTRFPYRQAFGWMSNNSVILDDTEDFNKLGEIAERVKVAGEPGYINRMNFKYGRINSRDVVKNDMAVGINPCGEIPLEHREVCNLSETYPTRCKSMDDWYLACKHSTLYMSTVSLLPTHRASTNRVVARNRRIGAGIVDYTGWKHTMGTHEVIKHMRKGYDIVCSTNRWANGEAGVPEAIRKTTAKPGGTTSKLVGKTSGVSHPTFTFTLMRVRVSVLQPICQLLIDSGVPYEPEIFDPQNTYVFEFPVKQGPAKPATEITLWEQAINVITVQSNWADNAVSNTLYFKPKWQLYKHLTTKFVAEKALEALGIVLNLDATSTHETSDYKVEVECFGDGVFGSCKIFKYNTHHEEDDIEGVLSAIAPHTKSISLLPHTSEGVYKQMPQEGITEEEYQRRINNIRPIDWSTLIGNTPEAELFCTGDKCQRP